MSSDNYTIYSNVLRQITSANRASLLSANFHFVESLTDDKNMSELAQTFYC